MRPMHVENVADARWAKLCHRALTIDLEGATVAGFG